MLVLPTLGVIRLERMQKQVYQQLHARQPTATSPAQQQRPGQQQQQQPAQQQDAGAGVQVPGSTTMTSSSSSGSGNLKHGQLVPQKQALLQAPATAAAGAGSQNHTDLDGPSSRNSEGVGLASLSLAGAPSSGSGSCTAAIADTLPAEQEVPSSAAFSSSAAPAGDNSSISQEATGRSTAPMKKKLKTTPAATGTSEESEIFASMEHSPRLAATAGAAAPRPAAGAEAASLFGLADLSPAAAPGSCDQAVRTAGGMLSGLHGLIPQITGLLGEQSTAVVLAAAAAAASGASPWPAGMPYYKSVAQRLPASIKVGLRQ